MRSKILPSSTDIILSSSTFIEACDPWEIIFPLRILRSFLITITCLLLPIDSPIKDWIEGIFTKICVSVDSEEELLEIYNKAKDSGLMCSLIQDVGLTEFGGVPTYTCCAIGPNWDTEIDPITSHLKLL